MQGRNRDTDIEDGYMDTERGGEGGTNWESNSDTYTLSCGRQTASRKLLKVYSTGSLAWSSVIT